MTSRPQILVPSFLAIAGLAAAADVTQQPPTVLGPGSTMAEVKPGKIQGGGRLVYLRGMVEADWLQKGNYTDANDAYSDHFSGSWLRAELGARVEVDSRVEVAVTVAYQGLMGSGGATDTGATYGTASTNAPPNGQSGNAVIDDAHVRLKEFLRFKSLTIDVGRQPFNYAVRADHHDFLYDSEADFQTITSWDGIRAAYNFDSVDATPFVFRMPDDSTLYGLGVSWQPAYSGDNRVYLQGAATMNKGVVMRDLSRAESLQTYSAGLTLRLAEVELFGEFAMQRGTQQGDVDFAGWGATAGLDWSLSSLTLGVQGDWLTGDDNPADNKNTAFQNKWEGISDTLIVEHEKYGELSRLLDGNLVASKAHLDYSLDEAKALRVRMVYANYKTDKAAPGRGKDFGQEADLQLNWKYTTNANIGLMVGAFKPGDAYRAVSPAGANAGSDLVYTFAANLLVRY